MANFNKFNKICMLSIEGSNDSNEILLYCQLGIFRSLITFIDYSAVDFLNLYMNKYFLDSKID